MARAAAAAALGAAALVAIVGWLNVRGEAPLDAQPAPAPTPEGVARGAYLARAGNCLGCHTADGGAAFAGGRAVETPFGTVFATNITPDEATGIGTWSAAEFRRALHHGRSKDGRLLYPAFPYPSFTIVTREDADALHAYLRGVAPARQANRPHALRFPYDTQAALAVWRALYFRAGRFEPDAAHGTAWNRGRYLVQGLGHCAACHSGRNVLGAVTLNTEFAGGLMPDRSWYAPSLASAQEAGVQRWPRADVVRLLKAGSTPRASVAGPMAEVVYRSTQHLNDADLDAIAQYLAAIPEREARTAERRDPAPTPGQMERGRGIYERHCSDCHGDRGQGVAEIYPALAGNRALTLDVANNVVQVIRWGGFAPATAASPRPYGMPPFGQLLEAEDIAAVATYVRRSWGNLAAPVSAPEVLQVR